MKHKQKFFHLVSAVLFGCLLSGCQPKTNEPSPLIAISKASDAYISWLRSADSSIRFIDLYPLPLDSALAVLHQCDGLLLTGGKDIYPGIYSDDPDTTHCGPFDFYRDTLEINLINIALEKELPLLGICRGEQLLNVVFGGTLYLDLPMDIDTMVRHRCEDYLTCNHSVWVTPGSLLQSICNCDSATVTTNHHQGIRSMAANLYAGAHSRDSLIEAIELKESRTYPFFLAVQWHPERMDTANPLSGPILRAFLAECFAFQQTYH